jgi:hypothetical protein
MRRCHDAAFEAQVDKRDVFVAGLQVVEVLEAASESLRRDGAPVELARRRPA